MKWIFTFFILIGYTANAQWKSYRLTNNDRDTINCIDDKDLKQGKWVIKVESLRGEPGYDEEGIYKDGKKEGTWRCYSSMGDLYAVERFRWGNKNGKSQYFNISGLVREESWKAVNPENPYDTVDVYDPLDPLKVEQKLVKMEGSAVKHGDWKFYESTSGKLIKKESYILGKLEVPKLAAAQSSESGPINIANIKPEEPPKKAKPKEVLEFEKKTGRKKAKVMDGSTGL